MDGSYSTHNAGKLCRNTFLPKTTRKNSFDDCGRWVDTGKELRGTRRGLDSSGLLL
jgi:hypothetical protein